jgi:hypothetical protein
MRPHVQALAEKTDESWKSRSISPGERALLCDMMIASVCSADPDFQRGVTPSHLRQLLSTRSATYSIQYLMPFQSNVAPAKS